MSTAAVVKKIEPTQQKVKSTRFRVTLCSTKVKDVERVCKDLLRQAKLNKAKVQGPARMPVKVLRVTTRRAPSGQGTATYERFTMKIYKRVIDVTSTSDALKKITSIPMAPSVDVVITVGK